MSQNSRSKNREAMQAAFDAPPKELGAAAVKAASKNDLDEFYEKIGTQKKNVKTMDDMYGDGSYHAVCEKCGYCAAACGDCEQYGCGKANTKGAHDPHGHKRRYWDKR